LPITSTAAVGIGAVLTVRVVFKRDLVNVLAGIFTMARNVPEAALKNNSLRRWKAKVSPVYGSNRALWINSNPPIATEERDVLLHKIRGEFSRPFNDC
jgi:hypothetical protein